MPHPPVTGGSTRQNHTPSKMPDVVIENTDRARNDYRSDRHHHQHGNHSNHGSHGNHVSSASNHIQPAVLSMDDSIGISPSTSHSNRPDIHSTKRKASYDPVSVCI